MCAENWLVKTWMIKFVKQILVGSSAAFDIFGGGVGTETLSDN
jgi:predicted Rossmann-fold nucleotide-binding protein